MMCVMCMCVMWCVCMCILWCVCMMCDLCVMCDVCDVACVCVCAGARAGTLPLELLISSLPCSLEDLPKKLPPA